MTSWTASCLALCALAGSTAIAASVNPPRRYPKHGDLCVSDSKVFTVRVDLHAGELGNYMIEECGMDLWNPTIAMEIGETYTLIQKDRTNYYHPIGIAYSPYGDEEVKIEAEPGISLGNPDCIATKTCPAPMYFLNDEYLGKYSNIASVKNITQDEEDFGLDVYEPLFMRSPHEWSAHGTFSIQLKIDDETIKNDLFYFCHVHEFMGGRIKLTKNGKLLKELDSPDLGYEYDTLSEFDKECGTFGLGDFELPNPLCPERFVCSNDDASAELQQFSACIDAMNCHMMAGMTTGIKALDESALFVHQMIPHHQNAVNMAKVLLKTNKLKCEDLANEDEPDCVLEAILYDIVNTQNVQIQMMYDYLDSKRLPEKDNCNVYIQTIPEPSVIFQSSTTSTSSTRVSSSRMSRMITAMGLVLGLIMGGVGAIF